MRRPLLAAICLVGCGRIDYVAMSPDAAAGPDARIDGGAIDGSAIDAGVSDAGTNDAGTSDAGASDGGATDGGATDGGPIDGGPIDGGPIDGGPIDGGPIDGGPIDAAPPDPCGGRVLFRDDFDDGTAGGEWGIVADPGMVIVEEGGRVHVRYAPFVTADSYAGYATPLARDLSLGCVTLDVSVVASAATNADTYMLVDGARDLSITVQAGNLEARVNDGPDVMVLARVPYDPVAHRYWRVRDAGSSVRYEVSDDGMRFEELAALLEPVSLTSTTLFFGSGVYLDTTDAGDAQFESILVSAP
jgi:hypothetical protein